MSGSMVYTLKETETTEPSTGGRYIMAESQKSTKKWRKTGKGEMILW